MQQPEQIQFSLPPWLSPFLAQQPSYLTTLEERMALVLEACAENIAHQSGGPFAAALFDQHSGELLSLGVNRVPTERLSPLHAEVVAIMLAERQLWGVSPRPSLQIVCSSEPCAMCLGAMSWAGITSLVTAASGADVEAIGFDEGDKPTTWQQKLQQRGVEVITGVAQQRAVLLLQQYQRSGGVIYNGG
ncbi:nucleoside deaminase [Ectothiorhodospiraceae bacterium BW-2]|nr:nucleoside deaminase [Ectothiorhodospiraceae bacterium BW-2]